MKLYHSVSALVLATGSEAALRKPTRHLQDTPVFPAYNQQCRDDAGPPFLDDSETFGTNKYFDGKPAQAVGDCPSPLTEACAGKPKTAAFLEGPIDCGGRGWFCRIEEETGWPTNGLTADLNFGYCNTTEGFEDDGFDRAGHCHGSESDGAFYWWVRDHWFRGYNGKLTCCCGWDTVTEGSVVNGCDYRRLVTPTEDLSQCRDANEEGVTPYRGGCDPSKAPPLNQPIALPDGMCWEVSKFGEPEEGGENEEEEEVNEDEEENEEEEEDEEPTGDENEEEEPSGDENEDEEEKPSGDENEENEENEEPSGDENEEDEEPSGDENEDNEEPSGDQNEEDENEEDNEEEMLCEDDAAFLFKNKPRKNCNWIKKKARKNAAICNKKSNGSSVKDACKAACGVCSSGDNENNNNIESGCLDDETFLFKNKPRKNCNWVKRKEKKKPGFCGKKSNGTIISTFCQVACGTCDVIAV